MLEQLRPLVRVGESAAEFLRSTGLIAGMCIGSGPGVEECYLLDCGLSLVVDRDGFIQSIRRRQRGEYRQMSISSRIMSMPGYTRGYFE
jgi:hypothetical protein